MNRCTASIQHQKERQNRYNTAYLKVLKGLPADLEIDSRSQVWNSIAYFHCGCPREANEILRTIPLYRCHFMPMQMLEILMDFDSQVEEDVRERMTAYIRESLPEAASERIHMEMYNDNFSNMALYILLIGGELLNLPEYVETGKRKLEEACEFFSRTGGIMEYCSPTYTAIDTLAYAQIANHVKDPWAREMALKCEERMWLEVASHYHPATAMLAGPHSRAYGADSIGHPGLICSLLWKVFGDEVFINPILDTFPAHPNQVIHISAERLMYPNVAWIVNVDYHCPERLAELALHKSYPFEVSFRSECLPANLLAGSSEPGKDPASYTYCSGGAGNAYTYMTEEYSLGTAASQFHSGAISNAFYVTFRNRTDARRLYDTGVVYARYLFNDHLPDQENTYAVYGAAHKSSFRDEGRRFGSQHQNISLSVYHPMALERHSVTSARLSMLIPCYFYEDFSIWAGDTRVENFSYASPLLETVYVQVHNTYMAFVPMTTTDLGRDIALRIEKQNQHILISYYNYHGEARSFEALDLILAQAGVICICSTVRQHPTMDSFKAYVQQGQLLEDRLEDQERVSCRRIRYRHGETEFRMIVCPETDTIVASTVNRKPAGLQIFQADGLEDYRIPFLS